MNCNSTNCYIWDDEGHGIYPDVDDDEHGNYPRIPEFLRILLIVILPLVCVVGIIGNSLVMWIFCRTKSLRIPPNVMIINLAVSDLMMNATLLPMMFISVINRIWVFGDGGCKLDGFCGAFFGISSISNLTVIAVDRCYSLEKLHSITYRRAFVMVFLVWLYSLVWAILPFVGIGEYVLEGYAVSCTFQYLKQSLRNKIYVGSLYCGAFAFPVSVMIICYWKIYLKVRATRQNLSTTLAVVSVGNNNGSRKKVSGIVGWRGRRLEFQIARVGAVLTLLFIASWTPYSTVALIGQYVNADLVNPMLQIIPVVFAKCSAAWDPFVYAIKHSSFRSALRIQFQSRSKTGSRNNSIDMIDDARDSSSAMSARSGMEKICHKNATCQGRLISNNNLKSGTLL